MIQDCTLRDFKCTLQRRPRKFVANIERPPAGWGRRAPEMNVDLFSTRASNAAARPAAWQREK
jgi:hypothetical protein